jgi:hypothetical protein
MFPMQLSDNFTFVSQVKIDIANAVAADCPVALCPGKYKLAFLNPTN